MSTISDHPLRYKLANELHARPFPSMAPPCSSAYVAIKQPNDAVSRDRQHDLDQRETPLCLHLHTFSGVRRMRRFRTI